MTTVTLVGGQQVIGYDRTVEPLPVYSGDGSADATAYASRNAGKSRTVYEFRGIPYAYPPVGERRFRPAEVMPAMEMDASDKWGAVPFQSFISEGDGNSEGRPEWGISNGSYEWENYPTIEAEDCLTLNIWTPDTSASLPVLVYFHGGGWGSGAAIFYKHRGHRLATKGLVVVTVEYRFSTFGFLYHPDFEGEPGVKGNLAITDQVAALQWIRAHIASFGGDPDTVTIMGESAGGAAVQGLIENYANVLFHRAFSLSGGGNGARTALSNAGDADDARRRGRRMWWAMPKDVHAWDDPTASVRQMAEQYGIPFALRHGPSPWAVMGFADGMNRYTDIDDGSVTTTYVATENVYPYKDGTLLSYDDAIRAFLGGVGADLPLMTSFVTNEASLIKSGGVYSTNTAALWARVGVTDEAAARAAVYPALSNSEYTRQLYGDVVFGYPARRLAAIHTDRGDNAWVVAFGFLSQGNGATTVDHGTDPAWWAGNVQWSVGLNGAEAKVYARDIKLADAMMQALANFCKHGNPNTSYTYADDFFLFESPTVLNIDRYNTVDKNICLISGSGGSDPAVTNTSNYRATQFDYFDANIGY